MVQNRDEDRFASAEAAKAQRFRQTVFVHLDAAYSLARYLTRRGDVAEDIVQEALMRAYRGFDSYRGENAKAWLLAIVRNCFLTWHRREAACAPTQETEAAYIEEHPAIEHETPEAHAMRHDDARAIRATLEHVPHPFREVLVLRDLEDLSYREIAQIIDAPIGTVMSRLARARKIFAAIWRDGEFTSDPATPAPEALSTETVK